MLPEFAIPPNFLEGLEGGSATPQVHTVGRILCRAGADGAMIYLHEPLLPVLPSI